MRGNCSSGFTLIELFIVMGMTMILAVPLASIYILPLRVHANLADLSKVTHARMKLTGHLADDVRCADQIEVAEQSDGRQQLVIQRGEEKVVYRANAKGELVRHIGGDNPLEFPFANIQARFSLDTTGQYLSLHVQFTSRYALIKSTVERNSHAVFCSHLEAHQ